MMLFLAGATSISWMACRRAAAAVIMRTRSPGAFACGKMTIVASSQLPRHWSWKESSNEYRSPATHRKACLEGACCPSPADARGASPKTFRGRSAARRAIHCGRRRRLPRLLEESYYQRNVESASATRGRIESASADRRHVPGREDQRDGESLCPARCPSRAKGGFDRRGWQECRARGPLGARSDGELRYSRAKRCLEGTHWETHSQYRQHRNRRFRSRAGHGL